MGDTAESTTPSALYHETLQRLRDITRPVWTNSAGILYTIRLLRYYPAVTR